MNSVFEYFRNSGYSFKKYNILSDASCHMCNKSVEGSAAYFFQDTTLSDFQYFYLHNTCSKLHISVYLHEHPLCLKENFSIEKNAACHICNKPIVGSPTYSCMSHDVDVHCQNFYLHKICVDQLPTQIDHNKHKIHPLSLLPRQDNYTCDICTRDVKVSYACVECEFDVCVFCAFEQRVLHHQGHKEHSLILMKKKALSDCDACHEEAKDYSYVCTTCDFWIHKSCALSPSIIPNPTYHHHPLTLVYSIPDIHRYFKQYCGICHKKVYKSYWVYYCHKCTYFVHMKCSTSTVSMGNKDEADDSDNESDLVQFPLPSRESMFDIIVAQCGKLKVDFQGKGENSDTITTIPNDPFIIEKHWSHKKHPLQQLKFTISQNCDDDSDDDNEVLICNGCIQPITVSHPSYYGCIQCDFFLHSFCATKLPQKLPVGASHFHPNHSLLLQMKDKFYDFVVCGVCNYSTNGFYYHCQTCDIYVDIRCAFLPSRIKHKSHNHHSLVQRPFFNSRCSISGLKFTTKNDMAYACESCSNFQIHLKCVFLPSSLEHKYEIHPITLRYPPFFYEGVFYCESCEERVNNQELLYHCTESEHSYHFYCGFWLNTIKLGAGTIKVLIADKPHTLALVLKRSTRKKSACSCSHCSTTFLLPRFFYECDGCGFLACSNCTAKLLGEKQRALL
ncbi:uncharacterized protein LOC108213342 isoform X1 [Daucus carota subsp. sativus]|uniref:uncharacterized protein LOC108213342 isoform X1 n=1 Tax=Daucus carota subsp. sativus TaxID=79200 RepID=UPI0007EF4891|nr:PREDICTED: uncharacterized protein LOC108213342 [Daucus carota subsp. sativus]